MSDTPRSIVYDALLQARLEYVEKFTFARELKLKFKQNYQATIQAMHEIHKMNLNASLNEIISQHVIPLLSQSETGWGKRSMKTLICKSVNEALTNNNYGTKIVVEKLIAPGLSQVALAARSMAGPYMPAEADGNQGRATHSEYRGSYVVLGADEVATLNPLPSDAPTADVAA